MGNAIRLAAGDPSSSAATTTSSPTTSDLASWMSQHALGSLSGNSLPQGRLHPDRQSGEQASYRRHLRRRGCSNSNECRAGSERFQH
jgi:hypothetical protein